MDKIKISEIFESIQGEGRYQGYPAVFIRISGCTRNCTFCDTKYHINYTEMTVNDVVTKVSKYNSSLVVFTGGEPTLWIDNIKQIIKKLPIKKHHIETNGDFIQSEQDLLDLCVYFDYICISPKDLIVAKRVYEIRQNMLDELQSLVDIKVVTDLNRIGEDMVKYATMLMPLTTYNPKRDKLIKQKVWNYCVKNRLFYSARLHVEVWNQTKKK